jgi:hypothetical protein
LKLYAAFPEDDRLEYEVLDAVRRHDRIQVTLNSESKAAELLARAVKAMELTLRAMQEALGYSRCGSRFLCSSFYAHFANQFLDMWGGRTYVAKDRFSTYMSPDNNSCRMADMMERSALRDAQENASQAEFLVNEARKFSSAVQPVGRVSIDQGFVIQILLFLFTPTLLTLVHFRSIVSDVFFDNIYTDIAFHSNINHLNLRLPKGLD